MIILFKIAQVDEYFPLQALVLYYKCTTHFEALSQQENKPNFFFPSQLSGSYNNQDE